jgi:hypothetical protein
VIFNVSLILLPPSATLEHVKEQIDHRGYDDREGDEREHTGDGERLRIFNDAMAKTGIGADRFRPED